MTFYLRKATERGQTKLDWLTSYHSFSFANYYDKNHISFKTLRVINDDLIAPNSGFGFHPHQNMEIITYLISGSILHRDDFGNEEILKAPQIQIMSAGSGIVHSEINPSESEKLKLLQIWIKPEQINIQPFYEQKVIEQKSTLTPLIVPRKNKNNCVDALTINQNIKMSRLVLKPNESFDFYTQNSIYLHLVSGEIEVIKPHQIILEAGDGLGLNESNEIKISTKQGVELLLLEFL